MRTKTIVFLGLIFLMILDAILPLPLVGLVLIHVIFNKPPWFAHVVQDIYQSGQEALNEAEK